MATTSATTSSQRYDLLARHFVELAHPQRTESEVVALLRTRTQRLPRFAT